MNKQEIIKRGDKVMSKNEEFIKEYLYDENGYNDYYEGVLFEIERDEFTTATQKKTATRVCDTSVYCDHFKHCDVSLHPLQKVFEIEDSTCSYPNSAYEFYYQSMFKYKGKYYKFVSEGGN